MGSLFSSAISCALRFFLAVIGNQAPALIVASFATAIQSLPWIRPTSTTTPPEGQPPYSSYIPSPTSAPNSNRLHPGSNKTESLSLAVILPLACSFLMRLAPPPFFTRSSFLSKPETRSRIRSSFLLRSRSFFFAMVPR